MKIICALALVSLLSMAAFAQTVTNLQSFPPPSPASQATLNKISKMTLLFDGKSLDGWNASVKGATQPDKTTVWTVKDGALASLGAGRGVLYTDKSFENYLRWVRLDSRN